MRLTREEAFMGGRRPATSGQVPSILLVWPILAIGLLTANLLLGSAHAGEKYWIKDIGVMGEGGTVEGLNERGEIVGTVPVGPGGLDLAGGGTRMAR